jgi:hypothetical protein
LIGLRDRKGVTDKAVASGCGVRRWDGDRFHIDWHRDRVAEAIRAVALSHGKPEVADALAAAIAKQEAGARAVANRRKQEVIEAARRQEEEEVISGLQVELQALLATDPGMSLLTAVEYITSDPARRIGLYRLL